MCIDCPAGLAADLDGAFALFVDHHQDLVLDVARRCVRRPADAEDLAQEAFLRAYRALRRWDAERIAALRSRGWMVSIVLNLARNRSRGRPPSPDADLGALGEPSDTAIRPDDAAELRESAAEWRARLDALPPRYRMAVALRHVQGLSYPEMAAALQRPLGTVKSDVHRGVRQLRAALERERSIERLEVAR